MGVRPVRICLRRVRALVGPEVGFSLQVRGDRAPHAARHQSRRRVVQVHAFGAPRRILAPGLQRFIHDVPSRRVVYSVAQAFSLCVFAWWGSEHRLKACAT